MSAPHDVTPKPLPVVAAIQAIARGDATPGQARIFMDWVVEIAANSYGQSAASFFPNAYENAFMSGRRFVGEEIRTCLSIDLSKYSKQLKERP